MATVQSVANQITGKPLFQINGAQFYSIKSTVVLEKDGVDTKVKSPAEQNQERVCI